MNNTSIEVHPIDSSHHKAIASQSKDQYSGMAQKKRTSAKHIRWGLSLEHLYELFIRWKNQKVKISDYRLQMASPSPATPFIGQDPLCK